MSWRWRSISVTRRLMTSETRSPAAYIVIRMARCLRFGVFWKSAATSAGLKTTGSFSSWRGYGICSIIHLRCRTSWKKKRSAHTVRLNGDPESFFPLDQEELVLADVFRSESIGCSFKVFGEVGYTTDVCAPRVG